jgi:hypothetical protein
MRRIFAAAMAALALAVAPASALTDSGSSNQPDTASWSQSV